MARLSGNRFDWEGTSEWKRLGQESSVTCHMGIYECAKNAYHRTRRKWL